MCDNDNVNHNDRAQHETAILHSNLSFTFLLIVCTIGMFLSLSGLLWSSTQAKPITTSFPYANHLGLGAGLFLRFEILIITAIG